MKNAQYYLKNPEKISYDLILDKPSGFLDRLSAIEISEEQVKRDFDTALDKDTTVILGHGYKTSEVLKNISLDFYNDVYFDWFDHNFARVWLTITPRVYPLDRFRQLLEDRIAELSVDK